MRTLFSPIKKLFFDNNFYDDPYKLLIKLYDRKNHIEIIIQY